MKNIFYTKDNLVENNFVKYYMASLNNVTESIHLLKFNYVPVLYIIKSLELCSSAGVCYDDKITFVVISISQHSV